MTIWFWVDFFSPLSPACQDASQKTDSNFELLHPQPKPVGIPLAEQFCDFCIYFAQSQESQQLYWQNKCKDAEETKAFCKMCLYSLSLEQQSYLPTCL